MRKSFPLSEVYRLLEPGPVVLLTTAGKGWANVMTQSWHMMIEFEPSMVACVVSNRNFTFKTLRTTEECVINIPTVELAEKVVACGNTTGREVDKFETFGLTPVAAFRVRAHLIVECYANLECRVADTREVNRYCLFVLEVLKAWIDPARKHPRTIHHMGRGTFMVAGKTIKLPLRTSSEFCVRAKARKIFFVLLGGTGLVLKGRYSEPWRGTAYSYGATSPPPSHCVLSLRFCFFTAGSGSCSRLA